MKSHTVVFLPCFWMAGSQCYFSYGWVRMILRPLDWPSGLVSYSWEIPEKFNKVETGLGLTWFNISIFGMAQAWVKLPIKCWWCVYNLSNYQFWSFLDLDRRIVDGSHLKKNSSKIELVSRWLFFPQNPRFSENAILSPNPSCLSLSLPFSIYFPHHFGEIGSHSPLPWDRSTFPQKKNCGKDSV